MLQRIIISIIKREVETCINPLIGFVEYLKGKIHNSNTFNEANCGLMVVCSPLLMMEIIGYFTEKCKVPQLNYVGFDVPIYIVRIQNPKGNVTMSFKLINTYV